MKYPPADPPPKVGESVYYTDMMSGHAVGIIGYADSSFRIHCAGSEDNRNSFAIEQEHLTRDPNGHLWTINALEIAHASAPPNQPDENEIVLADASKM